MKLIKLSKTPCGGCISVGNHLKDKEVDYVEVDILSDESTKAAFNLTSEEVREKYGITSVPVLLLLDDEGSVVDQVNGFNIPQIDGLLDKM
jgi:glutaredoxin